MAFTVYEYPNVLDGEPAQPPGIRAPAQAFGAAYVTAASTRYVAVVPDADMYLRISTEGAAASIADHKLLAGQTYGFPVRVGDVPKLYGLAA